MPIIFISLDEKFTETMKTHGYEAYTMNIQDFPPKKNRKTYYVSPTNSLCFMDGGFDYALSRIVFPDIETQVKELVRRLGILSKLGRPYLPIGSSLILQPDAHRYLVVAPTMLLPQDISNTRNAYFATMAVLYNVLVHQKETLAEIDILLPSFGCGYGKMAIDISVRQIMDGIRDFWTYAPTKLVYPHAILHEPNLDEQPKYYQNTEWLDVKPEAILLA